MLNLLDLCKPLLAYGINNKDRRIEAFAVLFKPFGTLCPKGHHGAVSVHGRVQACNIFLLSINFSSIAQ